MHICHFITSPSTKPLYDHTKNSTSSLLKHLYIIVLKQYSSEKQSKAITHEYITTHNVDDGHIVIHMF